MEYETFAPLGNFDALRSQHQEASVNIDLAPLRKAHLPMSWAAIFQRPAPASAAAANVLRQAGYGAEAENIAVASSGGQGAYSKSMPTTARPGGPNCLSRGWAV
jgi:hypothetical protein